MARLSPGLLPNDVIFSDVLGTTCFCQSVHVSRCGLASSVAYRVAGTSVLSTTEGRSCKDHARPLLSLKTCRVSTFTIMHCTDDEISALQFVEESKEHSQEVPQS